jgi:hypothetical protein
MDKLDLLRHIIELMMNSIVNTSEYDDGKYEALEDVIKEIEYLKSN